jgi:putative transposase
MEKLNKAYKFGLKPNQEQRDLIERTFGSARFIYNILLADSKVHYETTGKSKRFTPAMYKKEFPWLKKVDSLALANAQMNMKKAFTNFFQKRAQFPKFKSKKHPKSTYSTNSVNNSIRIEENKVKLPKLGLVTFVNHRLIPQDHKIKSATISRTSTGKYYISILTEYQMEIVKKPSDDMVGLDFSMKELYVSSEGEKSNFPRYYRAMEKKLARGQRKLSKRVKGSNNYHKQRLIVAKLHEKVANQRKDFLHKKSRELVSKCGTIAIEDLNMKGMSQALNFGKSVSDNGWGMFTTFLEYKSKLEGKQVVKIDKWYPSSKTCSSCDSGYVVDRDINASINIKREGHSLLAW